jgi:hypothetical protein
VPRKKQLTALTDLEAKEVSLVDRGANKKRRFPVFKKKELEMDPEILEILKAVGEEPLESEEQLDAWIEKQKLGEKEANAVRGAMRILSGFSDNASIKEMVKAMSALIGGKSENKTGDKACDEYGKPKEKTDKAKAEPDAEPEKPADDKEETVAKNDNAIPEAVQKMIDGERQAREKIEKELANERRLRRRTEIRAKVEKEYSLVPGMSHDEMADLLLDADEPTREVIEKQWAKVQEAMNASNLLRTAGANYPGDDGSSGDAWSEIEKMANGFVEKGDGSLSKAKAVERALNTDKGKLLYRQYMAENPKQFGA